jgi:hypothetical protein
MAVDGLRGLGTCVLVGSARAGTEVSFEMPVLQGGRTARHDPHQHLVRLRRAQLELPDLERRRARRHDGGSDLHGFPPEAIASGAKQSRHREPVWHEIASSLRSSQ